MKRLFQYIINSRIAPILIILIGSFFAFIISVSSPKPQKGIELPKPTPVFYEAITKKDISLKILTNGEVKPLNEINLISQVSGQIVKAADEFVDGGIIKAGSPLVWIDDRDYKLALISAESRVAQASKLLEREIAESELAKNDWEELGLGEASPLTLRIPQLKEAEAAEKAALADLEKAKLNLERTVVKLPFQGIIRQKKTGVGQFVGTGSILATAFSTEEVLIALPLTDTELSYLGLPLAYEEERPFSGPKVNFYSLVSNKISEWEGRIVRTAGSIDPLTRLVYVYAEVINPYQQSPPLAIGMFVDAVIEGKTIKNGFLVPNSAINNNSNIYVINTNDNLEIREIEVLGTENDYVIIKGEISEGERVVVSPLNNAKDGMALKPILLGKNIAR
ncbi:MAG: efflux transporter periplasmic adaptor subunit [Rhodobiaceae bacterium]|nr:efflux transporter periplasmic adaptor subunit [Rhodobiaceae bacterium]